MPLPSIYVRVWFIRAPIRVLAYFARRPSVEEAWLS